MDCSTHIFLFIAKYLRSIFRAYNPLELRDLFGVEKYSK